MYPASMGIGEGYWGILLEISKFFKLENIINIVVSIVGLRDCLADRIISKISFNTFIYLVTFRVIHVLL
jgi:hypothetical protein